MVANRYVLLGVVALAGAVVAGGRGDWNVFATAGGDLIHTDGLAFYARHGDIQTGPLSLLVAAGLSGTGWRNGFVLCVMITMALGFGCLVMIERTTSKPLGSVEELQIEKATMLGGFVLLFWWAKLGGYGHLDDATVLAAACGALFAHRRRQATFASLLVGVAIASKPWAVIFLPLAIDMSHSRVDWAGWARWRRLRPMTVALLIAAVAWAPFILDAPRSLHSLRPTVNVAADSVLRLLGGSAEQPPSWLRLAQLGLALATASLAVVRRVPEGTILAAVAVRLGTDPGTWGYYTPGLLLGALIWDVLRSPQRVPVTSYAMAVLLLPEWIVPSDLLRASLRLVACVVAVALVLTGRPVEQPEALTSPATTRSPGVA